MLKTTEDGLEPRVRGGNVALNAVRWLSSTTGSLKEKAVRGSIWLALADVANRLAGLLKIAVLGRLLLPSDFGLFGIALLLQSWVSTFTQTGIDSALIQKRGEIRSYLDTAWTVLLFRGAAVALLLFVAAPFGARFLGDPAATPVIRVVALMTPLWALTNPAVVYLRRDLEFQRDTLWRLSGVIAGLAVGVVLALMVRNVWALVFSMLASRVVEVAASYWIHPYRPRLALDWSRARELMRFGRWISVLHIGSFLERELDSLAAAKFFGTVPLGHYQVAKQIGDTPLSQLGTHAYGVLFPALSKVEGAPQLGRAFFSALSMLLSVLIPAACFLTLFAEPLVRLALGARWLVIVPLLQIVAWVGATRALAGVTSPLFLSMGQPKWATTGQMVKLLLAAGLIFPCMKAFGLPGIALAAAAASVATSLLLLVAAGRLAGLTLLKLASAFGPAILGAAPFVLVRLLAPVTPPSLVYPAVALAGVGSLSVVGCLLKANFFSRPATRMGNGCL